MPRSLSLRKEDGFYSLRLFQKYGVRAAFTTRKYDMGFERQGRVAAYKALGLDPKRVVCPSQVHGKNIFVATRPHRGAGAFERAKLLGHTDAVMTAEPGLSLAILTADCLPIFLFDPERRAIALVHAGWRGIEQRLAALAVVRMKEVYGSGAKSLLAAFGPAIRPCCYEVGRDFKKYFSSFLAEKNGALFFDMAGAAASQLEEAGLSRARIYDSRLCTSCANQEFFSFRKEGERAGRSMSVLELLERDARP